MNPDDARDEDRGYSPGTPNPWPDLPRYDPLDDDEDDDLIDVEEDEDDEDYEDGPQTILITGASGSIGRKLRAAWDDVYDLVLLDVVATAEGDDEVIAVDLADLDEGWMGHFHGVDTVIHLAANPDESAPWEELQGPNLDAMSNVFHAAALAGVDRVIFASSFQVMGAYLDLGDMPIRVDLPPRPLNPYGASKLMGERLGHSLAHAFDLTFIAVRLGCIQAGENRPETLPDDRARSLWLSNSDLIRLFDAAVETDLEDRPFLVVNGLSNNHGTHWDLDSAAELLGYDPQDDAFAEDL